MKNITADRLQKTPQSIIQKYTMIVDSNIKTMENIIKNRYNNLMKEYTKNIALLDSYSPLKTLARGYSVVTLTKTNKIIKSKEDVSKDDVINIKLSDGQIKASVI